ncbi:MAG TPA: ABC transporter substrate-binding protein [bacterium]|nr:ABC transporter substrate-binding protein [bacterium]
MMTRTRMTRRHFLAAAGTVGVAAAGVGLAPAVVRAQAPTRIVFWHSMGGNLGETVVKAFVDRFNASRTDIQVEAQFQGSYDDAVNKLRASIQSTAVPAVAQVYDIGTRFMIDSKGIVPMQDFIDREKFSLAQFEPNILAYYRVGDRLYSMPFNTSSAILYYNVDMFKKAGLDPKQPPRTFEEIDAAARKLVQSGTTKSGITIAIYGWFFEQLLARQGALYANNGNGRDKPASEVVYNREEAGARILDWWAGMVKDGIATNPGRPTAASQRAFVAGQTAMTVDSTAVLASLLRGAAGQFEVGTGYFPKPPAAKTGGSIVGGASAWILKNRPEKEQQAAWEFVKFISAPAQQAAWYVGTGYFPIRKDAYREPVAQAALAAHPQFLTAISELRSSPINRATQGALLGVFPEARQKSEEAIEARVLGRKSTRQALDDAARSVDQAIAVYNRTMGVA